MPSTLDITLDDEVTVAELRLVTELIVVAAGAPDSLESDVVDRVLGLEPPRTSVPPQRSAD